jgi:hypothetical protein
MMKSHNGIWHEITLDCLQWDCPAFADLYDSRGDVLSSDDTYFHVFPFMQEGAAKNLMNF